MYSDTKRKHPILRTNPQDPCAVCSQMHDRPNTMFCSAKCTALANTWRRRVRTGLVKLTILQFTIEFIDGVFPKFHLPDYMTRFYPSGQTSFYYSTPYTLDIRHAQLGDIWGVVEFEIGTHAAQFIRECNVKSAEDIHDFRKRFETWLSLGLQTDETHFICCECNNLFLKAGLTNWSDGKMCERCSFDRIPF